MNRKIFSRSGDLWGRGMFEQEWVGVERMQLVFDPLFKNQGVRIRIRRRGAIDFNIGKEQPAILQAGKQPVQIGALLAV